MRHSPPSPANPNFSYPYSRQTAQKQADTHRRPFPSPLPLDTPTVTQTHPWQNPTCGLALLTPTVEPLTCHQPINPPKKITQPPRPNPSSPAAHVPVPIPSLDHSPVTSSLSFTRQDEPLGTSHHSTLGKGFSLQKTTKISWKWVDFGSSQKNTTLVRPF